jgi:polar amino acid transport system substrate-binding protein
MTITEERSENMAMSIPYLANKQVAIVKKADVAKYGDTKDALIANAKDAVVIVEKGSAGEEIVCPVE